MADAALARVLSRGGFVALIASSRLLFSRGGSNVWDASRWRWNAAQGVAKEITPVLARRGWRLAPGAKATVN
jgi:hypothetical protein